MSEEVKTARFAFDTNGKPQLVVDDAIHHWEGGAFKTAEGVELAAEKRVAALTKAAELTAKGDPLAAKEFEALHGIASAHAADFKGATNPFQHLHDAKPFHDAYAAKKAEDLAQLLVAEKEAGAHLKHTPKETVAEFRRHLEGVKEGSYGTFKGDVTSARKLRESIDKVDFTAEKFDKAGAAEAHVDGLMAKYYDKKRGLSGLEGKLPEDVSTAITNGTTYSSAEDAISQFEAKIVKSESFLTEKAEEIIKLRKEAQPGLFVSKKSTEAATEALKQAEKSVADHLAKTPAHGVAYANLPEGVAKTLNEASTIKTAGSKAASEIGKEVGEAGKSGRGFAAKAFFTSEEKLAERASKVGKTIEEMPVWRKLSRGKMAGYAAGAVGVAYLAGIGRNPEQGKHIEQLSAQQQNPQQGLAM